MTGMETTQDQIVLTLEEAANIARCSYPTARKHIATGWASFSYREGREHRIVKEGLVDWIKAQPGVAAR